MEVEVEVEVEGVYRVCGGEGGLQDTYLRRDAGYGSGPDGAHVERYTQAGTSQIRKINN